MRGSVSVAPVLGDRRRGSSSEPLAQTPSSP